jgi:peptidoglycan/xylan/chitin deacetylase (PgdA/CDA1 family)
VFLPVALVASLAVAVTVIATCSSDGTGGGPRGGKTPGPAPATSEPGATATPADGADNDAAAEAGERFLAAVAGGEYGDAWELLADAPRASWGGAEAFGAFLERKFGGHKLGVTIGEATPVSGWRDPDTGASFQEAVALPYELRADGKDVPEFSLARVVVAQEDGEWRVAGPGPAGRRAPVLTPPPAAEGTLEVPILVYHHVAPEPPQDWQERTITVTSAEFEEQLAHLRDSGYRSVALAELANALFYGLPVPELPVLLMFDDGYEDNYLHALPLLREYGFSGSFAIVTGFAGSPGYMDSDQWRAMRDAGMEIVSHSVTHPDLGTLGAEGLAREMAQSRADLEGQTGVPVQALVYPYGEPFAYGSEEAQHRVTAALREAGYAVGVTNPLPGSWPVITQDAALPYELKRVMVPGGMAISRFALRLAGDDVQ